MLLATVSAGCQREAAEPVLGRVWASDQEGYGTAKPPSIFNGGDPTGLVEHMRWQSWGADRATGKGFSYLPHHGVAESTRERVLVVAFRLGECEGRSAYRALQWYFPSADVRSIVIDACPPRSIWPDSN